MKNREIKFRIWGHGLKPPRFVGDGCFDVARNNSLYTIQQFTGLKDKNGKEIYEGDIIKWNNPDKSSQAYRDWLGLSNIDVIKYRQNSWGFEIRSEHFGRDLSIEFEVIGNIFENKDLIKDK